MSFESVELKYVHIMPLFLKQRLFYMPRFVPNALRWCFLATK